MLPLAASGTWVGHAWCTPAKGEFFYKYKMGVKDGILTMIVDKIYYSFNVIKSSN